MEYTLIALAIGIALALLDFVLHRSHTGRQLFATLAGKLPRWSIWTVFLASVCGAAHIASGWAMLMLITAIATFGFVMLAWLSAADKGPIR